MKPLYAGPKLRELRQRLGLTQTAFARGLGLSLSYLNQMERNHRPLSRAALIGLSETYGADLAVFETDETARLVADLREALADPAFEPKPGLADVELLAANAPRLAHAFLALHRAHRAANERLAALDDRIGEAGLAMAPSPWEEVRDFFHYCDNYVDPVDRAAERFAERARLEEGAEARLAAWLSARHGIEARPGGPALRAYDAERRVLMLSAAAEPASRAFQMAHQVALIEQRETIEAALDLGAFRSREAREIAKIGLANYFAGAALLPYRRFLEAAAAERHDVEALARRFGASAEQICHRLSTLQRPGEKGVPFFFVRVDQAGTITKRHSATRLQFARHGGACPLWNVHQAFETPGRFIRQLAETPDGVRYLCLARDVTKPGGGFRAPVRRYAIGLGCEVAHAGALVYADDLDLANEAAYQPIGVSCRICPRDDCVQRSVPPLEKALSVDHARRGVTPYVIGG
ncbi:MAG: short-chain fatty acyl-CoA regulator family protein [Pikeienuella sp.]|uniref:helix-turn-helix domain-containing protein n=1 Tax=Pikeienuella sp. TaxID=2831957 RepID=UPI00391DEF31